MKYLPTSESTDQNHMFLKPLSRVLTIQNNYSIQHSAVMLGKKDNEFHLPL